MVIEQRNHHHHYHKQGIRSKSSGPQFSSPHPSGGFRGVNCRSFRAGACVCVLHSPPPPLARTYSSREPKTPKQQPRQGGKRTRPSSISPSSSRPSQAVLWAGPGFSNSPPPSSLPIPKFSLRQKRSISLEIPPIELSDDVEVKPHAKSAPSSPVGGSGYDFFNNNEAAIATENLRRILQLDIADN